MFVIAMCRVSRSRTKTEKEVGLRANLRGAIVRSRSPWLQRPRPESWVPERVPRNILDHRLACMPRITPLAEAVRAGKVPASGAFFEWPPATQARRDLLPRSKSRSHGARGESTNSRNFLRRLGIAQHCTLGSRDVNFPPNSRGRYADWVPATASKTGAFGC